MSDINVLIYQGKNGTKVELKPSENYETMWATQEQIASIFEKDISTISRHISNIFTERELEEKSNLQKMQIANSDKPVTFYSLDVIIAVGYRVNSLRATQFRIWATKILKEYIVKGFAMDDERLKDPKRNEYFRELLERVREIRASEKLFYQQVKDIYATAIDYEEKKGTKEVQEFFATIQNKLLYAITGKTAAELVLERANINDDNFGLTNWSGSIVRKGDICIAKNYLYKNEFDLLKSLVNQLLEYLEGQTLKNQAITVLEWQEKTDKLIAFNDYEVLKNAGGRSKDYMEKVVKGKYEEFDNGRKMKEKEKAEKEAVEDIKKIEKEVKEILKSKKSEKRIKKNKAEAENNKEAIDKIKKDHPELENKGFENKLKNISIKK